MITDLNKIVKEWSYRVNDGKPNPNNSTHLYHLSEILIENKWPFEVIDEFIHNLNEQETKFKGRTKDGGLRYFKTKDSLDKALEKGTVEPVEEPDKKDDEPKQDPTKLSGPDDFERPGDDTKKDSKPKLTPKQKTELTQADVELVETQLFMYEGDPQEKGGAGTPTSRTGECVTTYAGRKIKKLMEEGKSYQDSREEVRQELLKQAKSTKDGKKALLTPEWVDSGLRCLDWVEENIGIKKVDDFAWDTPEGNELVGSTGHGTSADMFVKTKDGRTIGISLKKDFKVFVYSGGLDKNMKQFSKDSGIELAENTTAEWYKNTKKKIYDDNIDKFNEPSVKEKVCEKFEAAKKSDEGYKKLFGYQTLPKKNRLVKIAQLSGKKDIKDVTCDDLYDNVVNAEKKPNDLKKIVFAFAQSDKDLDNSVGNIYSESRKMDTTLRDNIYEMLTQGDNSEKFKELVSQETHIDDVLFGTTGDELDSLEVIYGEKPKGESMKKEALVSMFGIDDDYEKWKNEEDPVKKEELKKSLQDKIKEKMIITKEKGKPVVGVRIKNPSPPPEESIKPLFTLSTRARGVTAAPTMEMGQTIFGGLAFKNGNVDINTWPDKDKKRYIEGEAGSILDDVEAEDVDFSNEEDVRNTISYLERLRDDLGSGSTFTEKSKLEKAINALKRGLGEE
jgi:hypothetical protein